MRRRREATGEELALWRLITRDAVPFSRRWTASAPGGVPVPAAKPAPTPTTAAIPVPAPTPGRPVAPLAPLRPGSLADMDRRTADRLRRGRLAIDGRMDLHGMTQATAHAALAAFIHRAWRDGWRCVLVVTGKGGAGPNSGFSPGGGPERGVLRRLVPVWLAESPLRAMVVAVQPARPADGGDGALYVLVRRRRDRPER